MHVVPEYWWNLGQCGKTVLLIKVVVHADGWILMSNLRICCVLYGRMKILEVILFNCWTLNLPVGDDSVNYLHITNCLLWLSQTTAIGWLSRHWMTVNLARSCLLCFYHMQWTAQGSVLAPSVCGFFCLYEISPEPLNGFVPYSHRRRVWSLPRTSLKVEVKGQDHQGQKVAFFGPFSGLRAKQ